MLELQSLIILAILLIVTWTKKKKTTEWKVSITIAIIVFTGAFHLWMMSLVSYHITQLSKDKYKVETRTTVNHLGDTLNVNYRLQRYK